MIELLAPAGDLERLKFAYLYGADGESLLSNPQQYGIAVVPSVTHATDTINSSLVVTAKSEGALAHVVTLVAGTSTLSAPTITVTGSGASKTITIDLAVDSTGTVTSTYGDIVDLNETMNDIISESNKERRFMTFDEILSKYRSDSESKFEQGTKFEQLMKRFLLTYSMYRGKFSDVWLWNEFPYREQISENDIGIDIVTRTVEGEDDLRQRGEVLQPRTDDLRHRAKRGPNWRRKFLRRLEGVCGKTRQGRFGTDKDRLRIRN